MYWWSDVNILQKQKRNPEEQTITPNNAGSQHLSNKTPSHCPSLLPFRTAARQETAAAPELPAGEAEDTISLGPQAA